MGWRSKLLFLLIVYFAGFATAIYYIVPSESKASCGYYNSDNGQGDTGVLGRFYDKAIEKASASFGGMDSQDFKENFNRGLQKLKEMAKNSPNTAEGAEDK